MTLDTKKPRVSLFRQILEDLTGLHELSSDQTPPLLAQMEKMSALLEDYQEAETAEALSEIAAQIHACQRESEPIVNAFLNEHHLSIADAREYFDNPDHLNASEWEMVQQMRERVSNMPVEQAPRERARKTRRKGSKV